MDLMKLLKETSCEKCNNVECNNGPIPLSKEFAHKGIHFELHIEDIVKQSTSY